MAEEIELKILIIGDNSAGKTQLILNYVDGYFPSTHVATIGVEYKIKKIKYKDIEINLHILEFNRNGTISCSTKKLFKKR